MAWLECQAPVRPGRDAGRSAPGQVRLHKVLTSLGSARGNDVVLEDVTIDANHATIMRQGAVFTLTATGALTVNGRPTRKITLAEGDQILAGGWKLVFHDGDPSHTGPVIRPADDAASYSQLEQLVALSADMMRDPTPDRLFATLLKGLVRLTKAEKGFVILFKDGQRHLAAAHNVAHDVLDLSRISDSIVDRVVETLQPLIVSDALRDTRFGKAQSVVDLKLSSVMCVPLIHAGDLLGVIYLGNDAITGLFTERDLTILRIYAAHAAVVVHHALMFNQLRIDNESLRKQLSRADYGELVGASSNMRQVFTLIRKVAPTDLSVLVLGETGTGKELVARELHARSTRKDAPFVAINCGAIPENLLESELFGHKKGAFTGADSDKIGRVEAAHKGTLFLDEIGEMPMNLQVKLLRVLQERKIERVGEVQPRSVDIRVIAATNREPREMIASAAFREDLYYRLNEVSIALPPLRDRGDDIALLAQHFLDTFRAQYGGKAKGFTNQALAALKSHPWPGNVRQLANHVKKAVILCDRPLINGQDLGLAEADRQPILPLADAQEQFKAEYIRRVLDLNNWNKAQTARDLGVDARTIFRFIEKIESEA